MQPNYSLVWGYLLEHGAYQGLHQRKIDSLFLNSQELSIALHLGARLCAHLYPPTWDFVSLELALVL